MDNEKTPKTLLGGMLHWKLPRTRPHVCFSAHHGDKRFIDCSQPIWNPNMKTALWNSDRLFCFTSSRCRQEKKPGQFSFWLWTSKAVNTSHTNTYHILRAVPVQVWESRRGGGGEGRPGQKSAGQEPLGHSEPRISETGNRKYRPRLTCSFSPWMSTAKWFFSLYLFIGLFPKKFGIF